MAGRDGDALEQYDAVITLSPADPDALYNSGIILWKLDRKEEALGRLRKLLANSPEDTDALFATASILLSTDDPAGSGEMVSRYLEKKPDDVEGWYLSAAGAERQQKYSRELEAFDRIIALDAKQADAWFGETRLLLTVIEDPQRGLDALSKALDAGFQGPGGHQSASRFTGTAGAGQGGSRAEGPQAVPGGGVRCAASSTPAAPTASPALRLPLGTPDRHRRPACWHTGRPACASQVADRAAVSV